MLKIYILFIKADTKLKKNACVWQGDGTGSAPQVLGSTGVPSISESWPPLCLAAAAAKLLQSCPTLCDPIDGSPSGSPVLGIPQARTLEWVAISFSNA